MNIPRFILPAILVLIAVASAGQQQTGFLWQSSAYSIWFPSKPAEQTQKGDAVNGAASIHSLSYRPTDTANDANLLYALMVTGYADSSNPLVNKDASFRGVIDGSVDRFHGKLTSVTDIQLKGFPGKSVRIAANNGAVIIRLRMYIVGKTMYLLETAALAGKDGNDPASRFLGSFTLKSP